jgi:hypothetical protein
MNLKTIIIIAAAALILIIGTNAAQWFFNDRKLTDTILQANDTIEFYKSQTEYVRSQTTMAFTIVNPVRSNTPVTPDNMRRIEIPMASVTHNTIIDERQFDEMWWRIDLQPGTIITADLIMREYRDDTSRWWDIMLDMYPVGLQVGEYIDIRVIFPHGEDFIVLSKKRVYGMYGETIKLMLTEQEIMILQGMLVDMYMNDRNGMTSYATMYVDPGMQLPAVMFYAIPVHIARFMENNPQIAQTDRDRSNLQANIDARMAIDAMLAEIPERVALAMMSGRGRQIAAISTAQREWETERRTNELQGQQSTTTQSTPQIDFNPWQ